MNCCGSGPHEPKPQRQSEKSESKTSILNKVVAWGLALILIAGLIYLLF